MRPVPRSALLLVLAGVAAGGGTAERSSREPAHVVIWESPAGVAAGGAGAHAGDQVISASAAGRTFPVLTPVDWLWFRAEWAPRGTVTLRLRRGARTFEALLPAGAQLEAGPALPPALAGEVRAVLEAPSPGGTPLGGLDQLESRVAAASGREEVFWLRLSLARVLLRWGAARRARELSERALAAARQLAHPRARLLALELHARVQLAGGELEAAAASARSLLDLTGGPDRQSLIRAAALHHLGRVLRALGRLPEARRRLSEALEIQHRLAAGSLAEAATLDELALLGSEQGRMDRALKLAERALAIRQARAPGSLEVARSFNTLGGLHLGAGELEAARSAFRRSLEIGRALPGTPGTYKALYNLALIAYQQRRLREASELLARARDALERRGGPDRLRAMVMDTGMLVALGRGDLAEAERLGTAALALHHRSDPGSLATAACLTNLGAVASRQGDTARARSRYLRALEILREAAPDGRDLPMILANLGDLALSEGNPRRAIPRFREALKRLEALHAPEISLAQLHQNLAHSYFVLGRLEASESEVRTALEIRRRAAPGSREVGTSLYLLGRIRLRQGRIREADRLYTGAEAILRARAPGTVFLAEVLHSIARLRLREGHREAAAAALGEAIRTLEEQVVRLGGTDTVRSAFREGYTTWYRELEELLVASGRPGQAYHVLERSRARILAAMLSERRLAPRTERARKLEARRLRLAARYDTILEQLAGAPEDRRDALRRRLDAVRREQDELRAALRRADPRLAALRDPSPLDAREAARQLPEGGAALAYSIGTERSLVFVLSADGSVAARGLPVGRADMERMVDLYRGLILGAPGSPGGAAALARARRALSRLLLDPVAPLLGRAGTLVILPDGPLHRLPFATLVLGSRTLCETRPVAVVPSMTVLAQLRRGEAEGPGAGPTLLAMANPGPPAEGLADAVARGGGSGPLPPIPGTVDEVRSLAALWPGPCRLATGADATEHRLCSLAPRARVVHLAAHVLLDGRHPLDSAVVLAPDPPPHRSNGLLQGWEVMESLHLRGSLVTLSGCEAGLGRERDGEGLVGLSRAFQYAGARAVLASLWRVDDRATVLLMRRVYAHLAGGATAAEALRAAQAELLHGSPPQEGLLARLGRLLHLAPCGPPLPPGAPVAWAAFQLYGDPGFTLR